MLQTGFGSTSRISTDTGRPFAPLSSDKNCSLPLMEDLYLGLAMAIPGFVALIGAIIGLLMAQAAILPKIRADNYKDKVSAGVTTGPPRPRPTQAMTCVDIQPRRLTQSSPSLCLNLVVDQVWRGRPLQTSRLSCRRFVHPLLLRVQLGECPTMLR